MGVIWYKIWFDLWNNKTRTLLAVLSIAAGVFAVGAIFGMSELLMTNLDESHHEAAPPHINVSLTTPIDKDTILNLKDVPGVEDVDPYNTIMIQYKLHPEDATWRQGVIYMRGNFDEQKYELVTLRQGQWPAQKNEIGIERMAAQFLDIGVGDKVTIKIGDNQRTYPITSFIRHPFVPPPQFMDLAFFFMNAEGLERFDIPDGKYANFYVRVTPYSADYAKEVATAIKDKLAKQGIGVGAFVYQDPDKHWGRAFFEGITLIQKLLALICVAISAILIFNTLSNLITQQTNQIGILKAIGGGTWTIIGIYLVSALLYGVLALMIALPLGAIVASKVTGIFLGLFNIDYGVFEVSKEAILFQVASALAAPLLAGLPPVLQGARLTVRQAIASYGLGGDYRSGRLDHLVEGIGQRWLPSYYATALGNMLRHKGRLLLTQLVLIAAGGGFLIVMSLISSLSLTLDNYFARQHYDTLIQFSENQRSSRVLSLVQSVAGVEQAELRLFQAASMFTAGQLTKEAGIGSFMEGIPSDSDFYSPLIVSGRWFAPGDRRVIVITRDSAKRNNIQIGDTVTLDLGEMGEDEWQVIGLYEPVFISDYVPETIYAPLEAMYQTTKKYNQGSYLYIRTISNDAASVTALTTQLKNMYEARNLKTAGSQTQPDLRNTYQWQFSTVVYMLLALSVIVALVGGLALMGTLSIAVIERTKEIGVLRAVGARSRTILGIFIMEGLLQGWLSWLIAIPISFLASPVVANQLGIAMFGATLDYRYDWLAAAIWFIVVSIISVIASILPARGAANISVRDSLAYA
jgi:putative ABC transport system permease protein